MRMRAHGIALIMGLLLLAALSLLAVMSANGMVLQRRMAANFEDRALALENADLAAAAARAWLDSRADVEREAGCQAGCLLPPSIHAVDELPPDPEFESADWWRSAAVPTGTHPESGEPFGTAPLPAGASYWLIEELHFAPFAEATLGLATAGIGYYRLYGRGSGKQAGSVAVTESIVARPWQGEYRPADFPTPASATAFCRQFDPQLPCGTLAWRQRK
ncbi:MAG: pilus assembly protein [Lysobacterales bacterium]|nr:MAG: pilus assembly protein [Xanthomonadales bacterium]